MSNSSETTLSSSTSAATESSFPAIADWPTISDALEPVSSSNGTIAESNGTTSEVQKCLSLLEEGKSKVVTNQPDAVLVLGMTGSGKTTFVKFLTTDDSRLISEEVDENVGEYLITDSANGVSSATIVSQTIFPELNVDAESKIAFYDAPGFADTRGLSVDLANSYFLRKVIFGSAQIRFVLTVNHTSVRRGVDRSDFLELLKHALQLVTNIDPYLDSFALVVTKVDNVLQRKKSGEVGLVSDEAVVENVAKFLADFKKSIPAVAQGDVARNLTKLVDKLLQKTGGKYEKISLFRRPNESGPLSKMELLQTGKAAIKKMVGENLKKVRPNTADFGFSISEESKNRVHEVIAKINENIVGQIADECKHKIDSYEKAKAQSADLYEMRKLLTRDFENFRNWLANLSDTLNLTEFTDSLVTVGQTMWAQFDGAEKNRILARGEFLPFLETIGTKKMVLSNSGAWIKGFKPYLDYLKDGADWYKFVTDLHHVLTGYEAQKKKDSFAQLLGRRVTDLTDGDFVELLKFCNLADPFEDIKSIAEDDSKVEQLSQVLNSTLAQETLNIYDEETDTYEIRGKFLKLSDIVGDQSMQKAKFVKIFAADKLFLDVDLIRGDKKLQALSLIAPTWEVVGEVRIKLDGQDGCCMPKQRAEIGQDGIPGYPGKAGANFFGMANHVINGDRLTISANGGRGSDGQNGGAGQDGQDGESPIIEHSWGCSSNGIDRFSYTQIGGVVQGVYCVYGESGGDGGDGGNGGAGGYGGYAGKVELLLPPSESQLAQIEVETRAGATGVPGAGGSGGRAGKAGRSWIHHSIFGHWKEASCSNSRRLTAEYGDCAADDYKRWGQGGMSGQAGANFNGREWARPNVAAINETLEKAQFEGFLRQNIEDDVVNRNSKMEFLENFGMNIAAGEGGQRSDSVTKIPLPLPLAQEAKRAKRYALTDKIGADCFVGPEWPVTEQITGESNPSGGSLTPQLPTQFSLTDTLVLADLIVKKLSKSKPNYLKFCAIDYRRAHFCALHLVSNFEKLLSEIAGDEASLDIDPVPLMEKLEKEIINGSGKNIGKILVESVENQSLYTKEELYRRLKNDLSID